MNASRWLVLGLATSGVACAALDGLSSVTAIQVVASLPLLLFLPGAAIVLAADPRHRHTRGAERILWAGLGSIVVSIAGGLLLNIIAALTRDIWLVYVLAVLLIACGLSALRGGDLDTASVKWKVGLRPTRGRTSATLLSLGAAGLLAGAIALSLYSSTTTDQEAFVQLWILPVPAGAGSTAAHAEVGLTNYEGRRETFEVSIESTTKVWLSHRVVVLGEGETWRYHLLRLNFKPVTALVYLASRPSLILHSVRLASPVR